MATTKDLLRTSTATSDVDVVVCKQCHAVYYQDYPAALSTHPVGVAVVPTADSLKFNQPSPVNIGQGTVQLVNNSYVSCSSCHSTHFVDSNSSTADGVGAALAVGDGRLLRTDGPLVVGSSAQDTADRRSAVCTACHPYKTHGNASEPMGCLTCHDAHTYGSTNIYVLRDTVTTTAFGTVTGLSYPTVPPTPMTDDYSWADASGATTNGYCEKCHGDLLSAAVSLPGGTRQHNVGENCRQCHAHNKVGAIRSFEGSGCDGCHGSPPAIDSSGGPNGFAVGYNSDTYYKLESTTPHTSHSGTGSAYNFACAFCHNEFPANHNTNPTYTYQTVLSGSSFQPAVMPTGSGLNPSYDRTLPGTCSDVACHSNGGARTETGRTYTAPRTPAVWDGGKGDIITAGVTNCAGCHGNTVGTMGNNSPSHNAHLNKGYSCSVCHKDTATNNTTLAAGAKNTWHINGSQNVAFAAGGTYNTSPGTCAVTCHRSATPDWDLPATGACGTCHQYSVANVATGTGPALGGAHAKHLYAAEGGVQLACTVCHTNNGATGIANTDHVNGTASLVSNYQSTVCNPCHGAQDTITAVGHPDRQPVWTDTGTVTCEGCHTGAYTSSWNYGTPVSAPVKGTFASLGHGGVAAFNTAYPTDKCKACHAATSNHFTVTADNMLTGGAPANSAFCQTCHASASFKVHFAAANGSMAGDSCLICHESHGTGMGTNTGMMLVKGSGYTDGSTRASFANGSFTGVCQTCHASGASGVKYFNTSTDDSSSHQGTSVCTQCHTHSKDPAFMYSAGTGCGNLGGCHDFPPRDNAHILHAPNSYAADLGGPVLDTADMSACEYCHIGADSYTYNPVTDRGASLNHGDGILRPSKMTTVGYVKATGRCASACHDGATGVTAAWSDNSLSCSACHYYEDTPSAANNTGPNQLTGSHNKHFAKPYICTSCHATPIVAGETTHITNRSGATELALVQGMAMAVAFEASVISDALNTGVDPSASGSNATCNNTACHDPSNGGYTATWSVANPVGCAFCHSNTDPGTGSHDEHMAAGVTALGLFGRDIVCTDCHNNSGTNDHRDGWVNFLPGMSYSGGAVATKGTFGTCTTSTCHNSGTVAATAVETPSWNTSSANCTICHGNAPATGAHASHVNATYIAGTCSECHTAANAVTHINGTRDLTNKVSAYNGSPNFTCTNKCHLGNTPNDWTGSGALACTDCHGSGIVPTSSLDRGWIGTLISGAHAKHLTTGYFTANCVDCHNDNTTHSPLDNAITAIGGGKVSSYAANDCTNTCHVATDTNDWTAGSRACVDCHVVGKTGLYDSGARDQAPTTGLHATSNALAHDDNFSTGKTCTSCHLANPTSQHLNKTGPTAFGSGGIVYNFAASITDYTANGCAATCHSDATVNGGTGKWYRRWNGVADAKPGVSNNPGDAVCDNCHGDGITAGTSTVDNLWNAGLSPTHQDSPDTPDTTIEMLVQHGNCKTCHGYGDPSYDKTWGVNHGDGEIRMNGPVGVGSEYDDANDGCLAACHTGSLTNPGDDNYNHTIPDSGWTSDYANYGSGDCNSCHAGLGRNHSGTSESQFTHDLHTTSGLGIGACTQCHPHDGTGANAQGSGVHNVGDNTVNFANKIPNTFDYTGAEFAGNCSTNTCHDTDDAEEEWKNVSLGGDACADCHDSGKTGAFSALSGSTPTSNKHGLHLANTALISNCAECHGATYGTLNPVSPYTNHITGTVEVGGQLTSYTNPSCANSCHNLAGNGAGAATWLTANANPLGCADCHNKAANTIAAPIHATLSTTVGPTGDKHSAHTTADTDYVANCATCHNHNGTLGNFATTGHVNGVQKTLVGTITVNGDKSCTNSCHLAASANEWISGTLVCTDCHTQALKTLGAGGDATMSGTEAPDTGKHTAHMNNTAFAGNCTDCHSHSGSLAVAGHVNGPTKTDIEVANDITVSPIPADDTCNNNCHIVADNRDWTVGTLLCADCHNAVGKIMNQGAWPPTSNNHNEHVVSNALGGSGNAAQNDCYACHNSTTNIAGALLTANFLHADGTATVAFNSNFGYEGVAATKPVAGANQSCSAVLCHNGVTTPLWNATSIACGDCHGTAATDDPKPVSASTAGSHTLHVDGNIGDYADCAKCHNGAAAYTATGGTNHQNLVVNLFGFVSASSDVAGDNNYSDSTEGGVNYQAGDATHVDNGTCSNIDCHLSGTPTWGAAAQGLPQRCDNCHNDGTPDDTLASAAPATGEHAAHIAANANYVDDCAGCHGAGANGGTHTGHGNLSLNLDAGVISTWDNGNNTCTNNCHLASNDDWDNDAPIVGGTLVCTDCHTQALKTLGAGGDGTMSGTVAPNTGKHTKHMLNTAFAGQCTDCHAHSGALATAGHVNGPTKTDIEVIPAITVNPDKSCTNSCHNAGALDDNWNTGTLECTDCHNAPGTAMHQGAWPPVSNKHTKHVGPAANAAYGDSANHSAVGAYEFGCGSCHGNTAADHANNTVNVSVTNWTALDKTCGQNSCHNDGKATPGAPALTADWDAAAPAQSCNMCHGNSPATAAHQVHAVGIHAVDIYTGTTGKLTTLTTPKAHGDATVSTTINCNICHSLTVTMARNKLGSECVSCHNGDANDAANIMSVADKSKHIDGQRQVVFASSLTAGGFKSKAQVRDNITLVSELDTNWTRTNGYKAATSYDGAKPAAAAFAGNTCSAIACHNGISATWQDPANDCSACHTSLPK